MNKLKLASTDATEDYLALGREAARGSDQPMLTMFALAEEFANDEGYTLSPSKAGTN